MLAETVGLMEILVVLAYIFAVVYLGWLGYVRTKTATDYLIAGRNIHPFVMALSYGATFISTSAIVGFGGVAGLFGMSLLWLVFLNIFFGIFVAFVFLGSPTRKMGHRLGAHTFPELLGKRYQSKFIQVFSGLVIFLFVPLYASAVLIGGCEFISTQFGVSYNVALLFFSLIIAAYVVVGGLKGVMYSDALQGSIMLIGMAFLLIATYIKLGGVTFAHENLTNMAALVPDGLQKIGHRGWTATPEFGFGSSSYNLWWISFSTICLGVGIGVLAQPQLIVRFMTVKSNRELNRAVPLGGVFILVMVGVAYIVGSLSNVYFSRFGEPFTGRIETMVDQQKGYAVLQLMQKQDGQWTDIEGKKVPVVLATDVEIQPEDAAAGIVKGRSISVVYAGGNAGQIIPNYITSAMPKWFALVFLLTLLSAAMSTLSSQFHTLGTSLGRDVYETVTGSYKNSMMVTRTGIIIGIIIAVLWSYGARESTMIARATAIFFGLCASTFLPAFIGGLFFKRMTKTAAISSMIVGFAVTSFWLLLVKSQEAESIGLVQKLTGGKTSILADYPNWPVVDPVVVALPISLLVAVIVAFMTKPEDEQHLQTCFGK
ncbi:MAG: sodium:solute symporter family protein [Phycisphaerae bacterium]